MPVADPAPIGPAVSVIIVTHNSAAVLPECLDRLEPALAGVRAEVLVVDNASSDDVAAVVARHRPDARLVQTGRNAGYSGGVNAGVAAAAAGSALLVLNPDVRLQPAAVPALLSALDRPGTGIAVPRIVHADGQLDLSLRRDPSAARVWAEALIGGDRAARRGWGERVGAGPDYERDTVTDWASGAVMLISRRCQQSVGDWDESFFLYSEETDLALRARDAGFVLRFVPEAGAVHLGGESGTAPRLYALLTVNRLRLYRRRHGRLGAGAFRAGLIAGELLRTFRGRGTSLAAVRALVTPSAADRLIAELSTRADQH